MIFLLFRRILIGSLSLSLIFSSIYLTQEATKPSLPVTTKENIFLPIVIIDAGHGGIDSGTLGKDNTPEKEINLSIAFKLNELLLLWGYETKMTRTEDKLIGEGEFSTIRSAKQADISKRLHLTEQQEHCILISIHQNHYHQSQYNGFQVFYNHNNPNNKILAETLQKTVVSNLQPYNTRGVKTIGTEIYLLYHCSKPAVMVECGFLSNPKELSLLKNQIYQSQIAYCIAMGLEEYLHNNPTFA